MMMRNFEQLKVMSAVMLTGIISLCSQESSAAGCPFKITDQTERGLIASRITDHAFSEHAAGMGAAGDRMAFRTLVLDGLNDAAPFKTFPAPKNGVMPSIIYKRIYWNAAGYVVIFDKNSWKCGTAFAPARGVDYFNNFTG
jgi:hypothetical protein